MKPIFKEIKYDLSASIVVFFVTVTLCLGIALASGAALFAGIIGSIVFGLASGSALDVSGPQLCLNHSGVNLTSGIRGLLASICNCHGISGHHTIFARFFRSWFHRFFLSVAGYQGLAGRHWPVDYSDTNS